ncbi:MAG TPA: multicopper oxidase family protein [Actinomycetota bacterium]|nr:multicopper oxidase family protein [Actinomycetota bacterium]
MDEPAGTHPHVEDLSAAALSQDVEGLPLAERPSIVAVEDGGTFVLRIHHVAKRIGDTTFRMLSYNGSIPGSILRVRQGSEILVDVHNETEMSTTVHWHGLRLANRYDGVPRETQEPIPPGGRYTHRLTFPDPGLYWYHPHMREDFAQEMGLYANVVVDPVDPSYWPSIDSELFLTLDDVLIEDGRIAAFDPHTSNFAAMGRFGNVLLAGGETEHATSLDRGETARFYLTNTANTRVFRVALPGARMKLVGADGGRYEREEWVDDVVLAPSERAVVDVAFDDAGTFELQHVTPGRVYTLSRVSVEERAGATRPSDFDVLRVNDEMVAERERVAVYAAAPPDKTLALVAEMDMGEPAGGEASVYVCPMHPEVVSPEPGSCPKCGMKLLAQAAPATPPGHGPQPSHPQGHHAHDDGDAGDDGIEWEDLMFDVNRRTTNANTRWKVVDRDTGRENGGIDWEFAAGDQVKIRIVNEMESDHPMHHPFHVHGERFLVIARNGAEEPNLVWKDTVLVRTGETVDILLDASNPGLWMAHCHIAEHLESGMMFSFRVHPAGGRRES